MEKLKTPVLINQFVELCNQHPELRVFVYIALLSGLLAIPLFSIQFFKPTDSILSDPSIAELPTQLFWQEVTQELLSHPDQMLHLRGELDDWVNDQKLDDPNFSVVLQLSYWRKLFPSYSQLSAEVLKNGKDYLRGNKEFIFHPEGVRDDLTVSAILNSEYVSLDAFPELVELAKKMFLVPNSSDQHFRMSIHFTATKYVFSPEQNSPSLCTVYYFELLDGLSGQVQSVSLSVQQSPRGSISFWRGISGYEMNSVSGFIGRDELSLVSPEAQLVRLLAEKFDSPFLPSLTTNK